MSLKSRAIEDPGYGKASSGFQRLVNRDGTFNVRRIGQGFFESRMAFNWLLTITWLQFLFFSFLLYLATNLVFSFAYFACGREAIGVSPQMDTLTFFLNTIYFSVQTSATIGYGILAPQGLIPNLLVILETFAGVIMVALVTGVVFARFSKPVSRIKTSDNILLSPYRDGVGLMFRLANQVNHQVLELHAKVFLSRIKIIDGKKERQFYNLHLERDTLSALALSWTIVHPLSEDSPLWGQSLKEIEEARTEILVTVLGMDETFNQTMYTRTSYRASEFVVGAKFEPMYHRADDGSHTILDLSKLGDYKEVMLPIFK